MEGRNSRAHYDALDSSGKLGLMFCSTRLCRPSDCCIGLLFEKDLRSPGPVSPP